MNQEIIQKQSEKYPAEKKRKECLDFSWIKLLKSISITDIVPI